MSMMGFFRGRMFKSIIMWIMAAVFALGMVFLVGLDPSVLFNGGGGPWAMKINGEHVGANVYQEARREASDRSQRQRAAGQDIDLDKEAQELLTLRALFLQQAEERGLTPKPRHLQRAIGKSADLTDQFRGYRGLPKSQAITLFWRSQSINRLRNTVQNMPLVAQYDIENSYREQNTKAKLRFVEFTYLSKEADIEVSDEDARAFYAAHGDLFWRPAGVDVEYVEIDPKVVTVDVPDADVEAYYERHKSDYVKPEEVKASHILIKLEPTATDEERATARAKIDEVLEEAKADGADFAELAREHSEDVGSGAGGGDLGFFARRGAMVEPFSAAAFALTTPGDLSPVVESQFGFHIISLTERRTPEQGLGVVRGAIESTLRTAAQVEKAREDAEELFFEIDAEGVEAATAQEAFASYAAALASTGYVARSDTSISSIGVGHDPKSLIRQSFETRPGVWKRPLEIQDRRGTTVLGYFITRVKSTRPAGIAPFDDVSEDVISIVKKQRARGLAIASAKALWSLYDGSEDIDSLAGKYEIADGDSTPPLRPRDTGEFATRPEGYVSGMGYCLPAMVAAFQMDQDQVLGVFEGRRAAYIVELVERTEADLTAMTDAETTNLRTSAMTRKGQTYFGVWYEDIRDRAVIEHNDEVIGAF